MIEWWCEPTIEWRYDLPYDPASHPRWDRVCMFARMTYGGKVWWHQRVIQPWTVERAIDSPTYMTVLAERMRRDLFDAAGVW